VVTVDNAQFLEAAHCMFSSEIHKCIYLTITLISHLPSTTVCKDRSVSVSL